MLEKCIYFSITTVFFLPLILTLQETISRFDQRYSSNEELMHEVGRLVRTCFTDTNKLITLSGNISQKLAQKIHESELTAVTRMSDEVPSIDIAYILAKQSMELYNEMFNFRYEHKAQGFILAAKSQPNLRHQFRELMNSRWWNAAGLFLIIDDGTTINNSCKNAQEFLWLAWRYNILSSVFLCQDMSQRLMMYSYNPFNNMAPKNWLKVSHRLGRRGHPWILFKRHPSDGPANCSEIFYDKTRTLNNYTMRSNAVLLKPRLLIDYQKKGLERYGGEEGRMMRCIFRFLNASVEDIPYTGKDPIGYFDPNGTYHGMLGDVFSGRVDIGLNARYMVNMWKLGMSYPYTSAAFCFVVKSRGNIPQWMNLAFVFDVWVSLGLVAVILLTASVLSYNSSVSAGCLNTLRLIITTSLLRPPSQVPTKFFLANVFVLIVIINGTFQGRLVSVLTKPRAHENPKTIADLKDTGYTVYGYLPFVGFIEDPVLRSRYEPRNSSMNCTERLIRGDHIICLDDCEISLMDSKQYTELYVVPQKLQSFHMFFVTSLDWPLMDRFNQLIRRLVEAGFPNYWRDFYTATGIGNYIASPLGKHSPFLSLTDLAFIFHWLLFGMLTATLVFFYELLSVRYGIKFRTR